MKSYTVEQIQSALAFLAMSTADMETGSAAEIAKEIGFQSLKQAAAILDKTPHTLANWHSAEPALFKCALIGAKFMLDTKNN